MNNITKGAVAAAAAAAILLGGAGTLAYWSDTDEIPGDGFEAGSLSLTSAAPCDDWTLDTEEDPSGATFVPSTDLLVPGDVVSKDCTFTIDAEGEHLRASVEAVPGTNTGALLSDLAFTTLLEVGGVEVTEITDDHDAQTLTVTIEATFDPAATGNMDAQAVLDAIDIVTTQIHS